MGRILKLPFILSINLIKLLVEGRYTEENKIFGESLRKKQAREMQIILEVSG